ncbi:hypothetical protein BH10CYA1_BH10CYA1_32070 [soil metagenome]
MSTSLRYLLSLAGAVGLVVLHTSQCLSQMPSLPNQQLAPPRLVPADAAEKWYGERPGDRRLRVEIRMNNSDSNASPENTYGQGEHFGNRTMQVQPLKITVDVIIPDKPGQMVPEVDFTMLENGQFSVLPQERPIFKLARAEVMRPGEPVVYIPSKPRRVSFLWGKKEYHAWRYEIVAHVQVRVRPEDGNPLPKPHPFVFSFAYATQLRADGIKDWQTVSSPVFGVTTNWTADSGPSVSIGHTEPAPQRPKMAVGLTLIFFGTTLSLWVWAGPILALMRRRNRLRKLDAEEEFWSVVRPVFADTLTPADAKLSLPRGYILYKTEARIIVRALKKYADDKGAGTGSGLLLQTMTFEAIEANKQNITCGDSICDLLSRLERSVLREGKRMAPGAGAEILEKLENLVHV